MPKTRKTASKKRARPAPARLKRKIEPKRQPQQCLRSKRQVYLLKKKLSAEETLGDPEQGRAQVLYNETHERRFPGACC